MDKRERAREANRRYRQKLKEAVHMKQRNVDNEEWIINQLNDIKQMLGKMCIEKKKNQTRKKTEPIGRFLELEY